MPKKLLLFSACVLMQCSCFGQHRTYIRIFDLQGKKIEKGYLLSLSDSSVSLVRSKSELKLPISGIGSIKTRHAPGHSVLTGSLWGAGIGMATFLISISSGSDSDIYPNEVVALGGAFAGGLLGALTGAIVGSKGERSELVIDGNYERWHNLKDTLAQVPDHSP